MWAPTSRRIQWPRPSRGRRETLCEHGAKRRSRTCGGRSTACRGRPGSRCSRASAQRDHRRRLHRPGRDLPDAGRPPGRRAHQLHLVRQRRGTASRFGGRRSRRARPARTAPGAARPHRAPRGEPARRRRRRPPTWRAAIAEHRGLLAIARRGRPDPGDPDRGPELRASPGWAWLRVVRALRRVRACPGAARAERGRRARAAAEAPA